LARRTCLAHLARAVADTARPAPDTGASGTILRTTKA
jgi:hypothetical protein